MKKLRHIFLVVYIFIVPGVLCLRADPYSADAGVSADGEDDSECSAVPEFKDFLTAGAGTLLSNAALFSFNRFILRAEYAQVDGSTIYDNLSSSWTWDQDTFVVNQLGHPYQGSFYFCAGRANGLSFSQSVFCNVLGSVTWEYFCENERQSVNDLICTTFGGAALGEVFHRLYLEAAAVKSPLAFLISPMDALNGLVTGKPSGKRPEDGISSFYNYISSGIIYEKDVFEHGAPDSRLIIGNFDGGFRLFYGNPFTCRKDVPYSFFTFDIGAGVTKGFYDVSVCTEGILNRFGTKYTDRSKIMLGTSMLFDVKWSNLAGLFSNGIGFSFRSLGEFDRGFSVTMGGSLGWLLFGGSDYYKLYKGNIILPDDGMERRLYDYGTGFYGRYSFCLEQKAFGCLLIEFKLTGFFDFKSEVPEYGSNGFSVVCVSNVAYDHIIRKTHSLGVNASLYSKYGHYYGDENILQNIYSVSLYGKRKLK